MQESPTFVLDGKEEGIFVTLVATGRRERYIWNRENRKEERTKISSKYGRIFDNIAFYLYNL